MTTVALVDGDAGLRFSELAAAPVLHRPDEPLRSRTAYAAAHVLPRATGENVPGAPAEIDWDATLAFRHHLWSWGLGVADAMDTAQRNMGLDAAATRELIARSAAEAAAVGGALVVGVNTDHLAEEMVSLGEIVDAYVAQLQFAEDQGAGVVLMASRHLARAAASAQDYEWVYREVLARAGAPVVLHWLGAAFDAQLHGYFGPTPAETVIRIMAENTDKVRGIKMSLLDAERETELRARLPRGIRMFTGDDYHYVELIEGDGRQHSDALLGAFAAIAPLASAALQALDAGDSNGYRRLLRPTEALARQIFATPTEFYKTGVAFLSWLNGHHPAFTMIGGLHAARSLPHLSEVLRLADAAGALTDPELAAQRWNALLALHGVLERRPA
ncbi:DUF993 family protein [Sciscionella sediminilitoris]|uniref:DUF993 family protein n=1 Tax=Sciscionella sediminilitoris TaxID=1445613 RepID=UPI0004DEFE03|nr:DUF993 family protein [Sciscionella sp. SE31]